MTDILKIAIPTFVFIVLFAIGGYQAVGNYWVGAVVGALVGFVCSIIASARRQRRTHWSGEMFPGNDENE